LINKNKSLNLTQKVEIDHTKKRGFIPSSNLILLAFATAFFSRILDTAGVPATINFLHFISIPFACTITLFTNKSRNKERLSTTNSIIVGLFLLLAVIIASAFVKMLYWILCYWLSHLFF